MRRQALACTFPKGRLTGHAWLRDNHTLGNGKKLKNQETRNAICQPPDLDHDHGTVVAGTVEVAVCSAAASRRDVVETSVLRWVRRLGSPGPWMPTHNINGKHSRFRKIIQKTTVELVVRSRPSSQRKRKRCRPFGAVVWG